MTRLRESQHKAAESAQKLHGLARRKRKDMDDYHQQRGVIYAPGAFDTGDGDQTLARGQQVEHSELTCVNSLNKIELIRRMTA
jgi:hypothetical protein